MGDLNGVCTFQRVADVTAGEKRGKTIRAYLDNFFIVTNGTLADHAEECLWMLARFKQCEWYCGEPDILPETMDVLGSRVGHGIRCPGTKTLQSIIDAPSPASIAAVDRFLGAYEWLS